MHPAATRSIRVDDSSRPPEQVMQDVFEQYSDLLALRTDMVRETSGGKPPDMRTGWLLWETSLTEFLYFEQTLIAPLPEKYYAEWNATPSRGARKGSKSLWIYERETGKKRYSVTTSAGVKIQPYFDVPSPSDENLYYFRVQSEPVDSDTIQIWVSSATAEAIRREVGDLGKNRVSKAIERASEASTVRESSALVYTGLARPIPITRRAFEMLRATWEGVSDEHCAQMFLDTLREMDSN